MPFVKMNTFGDVMSDNIDTKEPELSVRLRLINGNEYQVAVPIKITIDEFIVEITNHFKLHNDSWGLVLKSEEGNIHLFREDCGNEYLMDYLKDNENVYLSLIPQAVSG